MKKRVMINLGITIILSVISFLVYLFTTGDSFEKLLYYPEKGVYGPISVSPNGKEIYYSAFKEGQADIHIGNRDTGRNYNFTNTKEINEINPVLSPDGKKILYTASSYTDTLNQSIWISDINKGNKKQLTKSNELVTDAIFSPNGEKIYYLKAKEFEAETLAEEKAPRRIDLYEVSEDGKDNKRLTRFEAFIFSNLSITKSGETLSFILGLDGNRDDYKKQLNKIDGNAVGFDLVLFNTKTKSLRAINPKKKSFDTDYPVISPDGKQVVYVSFVSIKNEPSTSFFELFVMNTQTLEEKQITKLVSNIKEPIITQQGLYDQNYPDKEELMRIGWLDQDGKVEKLNFNGL